MYIHIVDSLDDNVRMILLPSSGGQAPIVYTYTVSGLNNPTGMTFDGTHIHIIDRNDDNVRMILPPTSGGQAPIVYTYTVSGLGDAQGIAFDGTHIHIIDRIDDNVRMILPPTSGGQAPIVYTYTVSGVGGPTGMAFDGTHIHIADSDDNFRMILLPSADGQAPIVHTYTVDGLNAPTGMTFDGTHIHILDASDDNFRMILPPSADGEIAGDDIVYTYTVSGLNNPTGMTFDGSIQNQATLTLSTTDTDIRAGEAVDIDIDSDIDISNFTASDCTVTNGTRGALTINSATSATLRVTAGSAGTLTVAIAEDAVDPGNAEASEDFTVNARVTATITFDDTEGESGGSTGVNIALSESVTGLLLSHLTASDGTLSNLTGSGTAWEADLAFPATGSGTIDIDLAIDSTTPQNAAASASIDYAEAAEAVLIADRLYFISTASDATSIARAYDFSGIVQPDDDIAIGAGFWQGGLSSDTYIYFVSNGTNVAAAYDFFGSRQAANDISLDSNSWQGAVASDTRLYFVSDSSNEAVAYDFDGNRQSDDDISLGGGAWVATSRSDDRLYFVNDSVDIARAYDFDGNRQADDDITLGTGNWRGGLRSDTRLYFVNGTNAIAYDYSGVRQSADDIALGAGRWQGGATIFGEAAADALSFGTDTIANQAGVVGTAASVTLPTATGGTGTITYSLSPTLPAGKTFVAGTRVLAGNPTGRFTSETFTYTATDGNSDTVELTFTVVVTAVAITFASNIANQSWVVGTAVNLTLPTASGGVGSFGYSLTPALPAGVTRSTRVVSGTPTATATVTTYTYTATDSEGVTQTQTFTIVVAAEAVTTAGGRLYFISTASDATSTAHAYDFDGARQSADDILLGAGFWQGGLASDTYIYFVNNGTNTAVAYDFDGARQTSADISLASASWQAAVASDTRLYFVSDSGNTADAYDFDGDRQSSDDISLGTGVWAATSRSNNRLYFVNDTTNVALAYDFDGNRQSGDDISLGTGGWRGGLSSDTRLYFVNGTNAIAYDFDGTRQSSDDIALGTGRWQGGATIFGEAAADALSFGTDTIANQAGVVGTAASVTLPEATGGTGTITYSLSPTLPSGKTFTASTRVLAGNPTATFTSETFTYTAEDEDGDTVDLTFTIVVTAAAVALSFGSEAINNQAWVVGTAATVTLPQATGGEGTITYSLSPTLPSGKTFVASTRVLSGNPTGRFTSATFTYTAEDADGTTVDLTFTIVVTATAISFASTVANQSWEVGTAVSLTLPAASGGVGSFSYSLTPALPAGVSRSNRVVSGTPTAVSASATYTYTATDSEGVTQTQTFTIVVAAEDETVVTSGNIHVIDNSGDEVAVVPTNTADGVTAVASRTYLLPTQITSPEGGVLVDGNIHVADNTGDEVAVIPTDTADGDRVVADRIYRLPTGITSPRGIAADADGNIHVVNRSSSGSSVAVLPSDVADGVTAVAIRTYLLPTSITSPEGAVDADGNIHFIDNSGDEVAVLPPDTADGVRAVAIRTYLLPTGLNSPRGITLDGDGNLHVANNSGDEVSVIPSDVADGVTAVAIRTYLLPTGITSPEGLVFVPDSEPVVTVPSAPTSLALTKTHNSISATFAAPTDLGGGVLSRYDIRIDGGAWVDTGLDLAHTFSTLGAETEYTVDVAGVNSAGRGATASLSATTDAAPVVITVPSAPTSLALTKTHNSISATFAAPTDIGNGTISRYDIRIDGGAWVDTGLDLAHTFGTLEAETEYTVDVAAVNSAGHGAIATLSATTDAAAVALSFGSESINNQAWVVGTAATVTLPQATGGEGTITYSLSPTLPAGKTFVASTRVLSGTPTGRFTSATFTYTAEDADGTTVELTFTIVVTATAISFASAIANQSWVVGTAVSVTLPTASGGVGAFTYSLTGTLPDGTTFTAGTRALAGTPTGRFTSATFTYTAEDAEGITQTQTFTIVVTADAIVFSPTSFANQSWVVGTAVALNLPSASGGVGTLTASLSPTTPAGVTFTASTRALAGNPTGVFTSATFTYTMTDAEGETESITFTIVVTAAAVALSFGSETISNQAWVVGTAITSVTLPETTGGTGDKTYTLSPTTPAGITFTGTTRVLAGNPTATFTSATFTYTATDEDDDTVELTFTIVVTADAITFASTIADQSWVVGTAVDETLPTASGGVGDLTYSLSPTTPAGVTFTASTRALAGNPTAVFTLATFTYTVTDAESETLEQTFTIVVSAVIAVASTTSTEATYNAEMGYNVLPESLGALKKINASGGVESLGNLWYDERPYNVAGARALSFDDELHVTMGYGNANEVLRYNSLASKADNFVHLVFGNKLKYIVPAFQPSGNVYNKIAELARQVGATVSFDGNLISIVDRRPFRAKADGTTGTGTGNLDFDSENKAFPTGGYLRIGDEFIGYTGISSGAFTGIIRGALGSEPVNHLDNTGVLYANALFSEREILKIDASTDTTRHHNIIRDGDNLFEVSDETNIAQYRKQPYTLNLGLTRNEDAWIETIFAEYLSELKNLGSVFDLQLRPRKKSFALDLGQLIGLRHGSVAYVLRVELINYHLNRVDIKGRSVATETS